jgi:hypothetical protein
VHILKSGNKKQMIRWEARANEMRKRKHHTAQEHADGNNKSKEEQLLDLGSIEAMQAYS